ncbi:hypothetical protein GCM10009785_25270 [Brooklawnia cerclae]|uniref:Enamine deaminase RidA (YjgF/YER057c/UK114 family) n=1 Tax=Brooklawnia cerclae TaxID=349934 RepID=A0ABX0SB03_9ACTN|nr:RidA family protein [Brooklawnia cerclae]NIH55509.1 enamine deaminase RidA (YjgF/YER057c/UK114 family) [Brooklawnia cerclae]
MDKRSVPFGDAMGMEVAFSNAIEVPISPDTSLIWVAGQIAFDEAGHLVGVGDIAAQTEQAIANIRAILARFGGDLSDVTNVLVFVTTLEGLAEVHRVRLAHFSEPFPASTLVQVGALVHPDALIEIQAQAVVRRDPAVGRQHPD